MNRSRKIVGMLLLAAAGLALFDAPNATAHSLATKTNAPAANFGTIRGFVRDENGTPVANALIALFRDGAAAVRQIRTTANGSFAVRVVPGRYSLTAMAEGFSVVSLSEVDVEKSAEVAYRFNLTRSGDGNTLPERRADRNDPKYSRRANNSRRTVFQNNQGTGETAAAIEKIETAENENAVAETSFSQRGQSAVETYAASSANPNIGNYAGLNFATLQPINENFDLVISGQTGFGANAPQRIETSAKFKLNDWHRLNFNVGGAALGKIDLNERDDLRGAEIGQISLQAIDEWRVKDNLIIVVGIDYARFINASGESSTAPRLGLQFEPNAKTRFSAAYTTQNESRSWSEASELEDARVLFRAPNVEPYAVVDRQILMPKMRRFEFGVERVLDNSSSVETSAFFDVTSNRGVSLSNLPLTAFDNDADADNFSTAVQNGSAQGFRVVYSRRFNAVFSTSAGYALGRGQSLSSDGVDNPANLFDDEFFQTLSAQLAADFASGTQIRTVWRYAPRAAVFAIDPFAGRMAVLEPSVSVLVTQKLPTWGLPVRAKAMIDARNLFDFQTAAANSETALRLNSSRRVLRGGIAVRF